MRLAIFSAVWALATADQVVQDPTNNLCRRHQHQTCVIDSKLYVDGGLIYYGKSIKDSRPERNTKLIWGNLSQLDSGLPPLHNDLPKGSDVPTVSGGVLWPDQVNKLFYLFGGEYNNGSMQSFTGLWFFDTIYNKWDRAVSPDDSQAQVSWPAFGASTVTGDGIAYYYGGYLTENSVSGWTGKPLMLNSLISYDLNTRRWANRTDGIPRAEGTLQYIPAGNTGMLINFGGVETLAGGYVTYANMSQIQVFDRANGRWLTQTATGTEIPRSRRGFCAGVAWAKDYSSYNIYIFGGIASDETALGDRWILSLPSFRWIQYPESQDKIWYGGKAWASCSLISKAQMIIIGGFLTNTSRTECDRRADVGAQHSLLLGQESIERGDSWGVLKSVDVEYRVPGNITAVIGGSIDGKASVTAPALGWATRDLYDGFAQPPYTAVSRVATRPIPSTTPTSSNTPSSGSSTNVGAIAGGAVGGGVALIAIFALAFFCLRSRRQKPAPGPESTTQPNSTTDTSNPNADGKSTAHFSMSQGSTMYSPHSQAPAYSPQGSPPPQSDVYNSAYYNESPLQHQHSGYEWNQPGGLGFAPQHGHEQTYYAVHQDPSNSPRGGARTMSAELPGSYTPADPAELPGMTARNSVPRRP